MQIDHGVLAACFNLQRGEGLYCIIQLFQPMDTFRISVSNEYDCPLLSLSLAFFVVLQSVSIIHECTSTCMVKNVTSSCIIEHLSVSSQKQLLYTTTNTLNYYLLCAIIFIVYCLVYTIIDIISLIQIN